MVNLRKGEPSSIENIPAYVGPDYFSHQAFSIRAVHTKTFILLLAQLNPLSFVSGAPITLGAALQTYNRNEFHRLYPRAFLRGQHRSTDEINALANSAFMSSADNKVLGGVAPSKYRSRMDTNALPKILEHAACPSTLFDDDYDAFVAERSKQLANIAKNLMDI